MARMKKLLFFITAVLFFQPDISLAQSGAQVICNASGNQWQCTMDGNYLVWLDERSTIPQIYLYNLLDSTTQQITNSSNQKFRPHISGTKIIWEEEINGETDIYIFDIANPQFGVYPLIDFPFDQFILTFKDGKLLFRDFSCLNYGCLVYYDLNTTPPIFFNITDQDDGPATEADVDGSLVVYCLNDDIYLYNILNNTHTQLTNDDITQSHPSISNLKVCWEASENDSETDIYILDYYLCQRFNHIFYLNISKRFIEPARSQTSNQRFPRLEGKSLVFSDDYSGKFSIYLYSMLSASVFGTATEIYKSDYNNLMPWIDEQKICWWDDKNDPWRYPPTNADVYLWKRPAGADLSITSNLSATNSQINEYLTITFAVTNSGPMVATNVHFIDSLSNKFEIISVSADDGTVGWANDNIISWSINNLPADSSVTITVVCKSKNAGEARNHGSVYSDQPDYLLTNNQIDFAFYIFDTRRNLLDISLRGTNPKIRVDKNGFTHILTYKDLPALVTYVTNKTGRWTQEIIDMSSGDLFVIGADLDVDSQGNVHVVYVISPYSPSYPDKTLYYANNISGQWQITIPLGPSSGEMYSPLIKVDNNGSIHIGYKTSKLFQGQLKYINNISGNWGSPEIISDLWNSFSMAVDKNNFIHFALYTINLGPIYITNSPDGLWHSPEVIDQGWTGGQLETLVLDLAVDSSNTPHISYVGNYINNEDYKYAIRLNDTWHTYFVDTCGFMGGFNVIAVDNNGIPSIMYVSPDSDELRYARKENSTFVNNVIYFNFGDFLSENFDIDTDPSNNIQFVFYKNGLYWGTNSPYTINFGGGDENSGGYFFANSISGGSPSHPEYYWLDPVAFGHNVVTSWTEGNGDDGYFGPVDLPFNFQFFSDTYNSVFICSNGYLSFLNGHTLTAANSTIPFVIEPNNFLAACAMDLIVDNNLYPDSRVYFGNVDNKFVVTYFHARPKYSTNVYITFQIILYPNGNILYQYNNTESTYPLPDEIAQDALIGIENQFGTKGVCYRNNGAGGPIFSSPLAVMFGMNNLILPVIDEINNVPNSFGLFQNYPNPFNPVTHIRFQIPERSHVKITVFNILGEQVQTLLDDEKDKGIYEITFDASNLSTGIYLCRMQAGNYISIKKMLYLK
ncbi:T9SS type A sorting domain-containing protein [Ignavibacterium album]|uniref:T9SS type A sorting domain-containing protein n=1 Tax=Ignavibacterium album TaxID=591197 RepID=UPI0026E9297A|nr:T9SS type A sorting domain-containing protein [Ignavibacterium album]